KNKEPKLTTNELTLKQLASIEKIKILRNCIKSENRTFDVETITAKILEKSVLEAFETQRKIKGNFSDHKLNSQNEYITILFAIVSKATSMTETQINGMRSVLLVALKLLAEKGGKGLSISYETVTRRASLIPIVEKEEITNNFDKCVGYGISTDSSTYGDHYLSLYARFVYKDCTFEEKRLSICRYYDSKTRLTGQRGSIKLCVVFTIPIFQNCVHFVVMEI
ncbi:hypothetical protein EIN_088530, partial [Entamoeba invadens IP1]